MNRIRWAAVRERGRILSGMTGVLVLAVNLHARAGGGEGYHGGAGSFDSYGGEGAGEGGLSGPLLYFALQLVFHHPLVGIPLVGLVLWFLYAGGAKVNNVRVDSRIAREVERESEIQRVDSLTKIKSADPAFDETVFLGRVRAAFLAIQQAWSDQNISSVRSFLSDGVFERFNRQIADQRSRNIRNRLGDVRVTDIRTLVYRTGIQYQSAYVAVTASAIDEIVSLGDGSVKTSTRSDFREIWTLLRRPGAQTLARPGAIEGHCPSCGAPLKITDRAKCETCGGWVNSGEHDWVLVKITQSIEWQFPDAEKRIVGWESMAKADPGMSLESIEDRTAVVFWRWLEARRRRDPGLLGGMAKDSFIKGLTLDAAVQDAAVGAVDVVAFEKSGEFDRAHVRVKWEAERPGTGRQWCSHIFIFSRKAGATSDVSAGLSAIRCSSCGAPPEREEGVSCAYCGRAFNDGETQWVLDGIVPLSAWRAPEVLEESGPSDALLPGLAWGQALAPREAVAILVTAMEADGFVSEKEQKYLNAYAVRRGVDIPTVDSLVEAARAKRLEVPRPADRFQAVVFLRGLIRMGLADGRIAPEEQKIMIAFGARYGLMAPRVNELIHEERSALIGRS